MAKVTSKLQVTLPKRIAEQYGVEPGDELEFVPAGDNIQIVLGGSDSGSRFAIEERLRLFDEATERQRRREKGMPPPGKRRGKRDWKREDLYSRGSSD